MTDIEARITELERRTTLLIRLSRLNLIPMPDERIRGYCEDFQALAKQVESENPVPLNGSIALVADFCQPPDEQ